MITIIAAMTEKGVIGHEGKLPWHLPDDMKLFRERTIGNVVVMGRKTYESLPEKFRPLPQRHNIVLSRGAVLPDVEVCSSVEECIETAKKYGKEIFVIGGATVYKEFLTHADRMLISRIKKGYEGNVFFPHWVQKEWTIKEQQDFPDFTLITYRRKQ